MTKIKIDTKWIGEDYPCYTIAEAGANHDSSVEKAFKLIDAAVGASSDSIKFQTYKASRLVTKNAPKYWSDGKDNETQYDTFKKLDLLEDEDWKQIFEYAAKKSITCFSTPFDEDSANLLYDLGVPAFKIASADITHIPLIKHIAKKKLPIFISTGMANNTEIGEAIKTIEDTGNHDIVIMHCITSYPTQPEDANLSMITTLKEKFPQCVMGFSDHTLGTTIALCSTFYGAKCIEKHFTYDKTIEGSPDHKLSLDKTDFSHLVSQLRLSEISKGKSVRDEFNAEVEAVKYARRSVVSKKLIPKNTIISGDMLDIKRPGTGIQPKFLDKVIGSKTIKEIIEDTPIQWDDLDEKK